VCKTVVQVRVTSGSKRSAHATDGAPDFGLKKPFDGRKSLMEPFKGIREGAVKERVRSVGSFTMRLTFSIEA
jgi:hypothetical protein